MTGQDIGLDGFVRLQGRGFLRLSGEDRLKFLQGLVSNDVDAATPGHAVYSCLLTPQGKFLHDFFLIANGDSLLIECEADRRADLAQRLKMYKLRSKIEIAEADFDVFAVFGAAALNSDAILYPDPRGPALGTRVALPASGAVSPSIPFDSYDRLRIANAVPDGSRDMEIGKAILLENNIDLLNGIAWDKGCYTGQELTARTRYRGLIKKRLIPVRIAGAAPPIGTPLIEGGSEVGEMRSANGDLGLALLRFERLRKGTPIEIDGATLTPEPPPALAAVLAEKQA